MPVSQSMEHLWGALYKATSRSLKSAGETDKAEPHLSPDGTSRNGVNTLFWHGGHSTSRLKTDLSSVVQVARAALSLDLAGHLHRSLLPELQFELWIISLANASHFARGEWFAIYIYIYT